MKFVKLILITLSFYFPLLKISHALSGLSPSLSTKKISVFPKQCVDGLIKGPYDKFAVYVFCDDAAGTTIGIINIQPGTSFEPGEEPCWKLEDRFWQDSQWARDVHHIQWSEDGTKLIVCTGEIYGTNATYTLDLIHKKIINIKR